MTPCCAATGGRCMNVSCGRWRHRAPSQRDSAVDDLVHHAVLAEAWPEAARYALAAGERASRRSAMTEAKAYLETAIAALSQQPASVATMTHGNRCPSQPAGRSRLDERYFRDPGIPERSRQSGRTGRRPAQSCPRVYQSRRHAVPFGRPARRHRTEPDSARYHAAGSDSVGIVSAAFSLAQAQWYSGDLDDARQMLLSNISHARGESGQRRSTATFVLPSVVFFCYLARIHGDLGDSAAGFDAVKGSAHDRRQARPCLRSAAGEQL